MKLREILVAEGAAKTTDELSNDVIVAAQRLGYFDGLWLVVAEYKKAAAMRRAVEGVNESGESVGLFVRFATKSRDLAANLDMNPVVRALLLHNAACALSKYNGNRSGDQKFYNAQAKGVLSLVDETLRNDDWQCVHEKVMIGLYEAGHLPFIEERYRAVLENMSTNGSKDTAGRRHFLARKLVEQGRFIDAKDVLVPVTTDTTSAPNQVKQAVELLAEVEAVLKNF